MNELQIIKNDVEIFDRKFNIYGTLETPLFMAKDVAKWIEYSKDGKGNYNVSSMLKNVDSDEKIKMNTNLNNVKVGANTWFLTEDGLYEVLMQSRKPIAKQFKKKIKEILKALRLTGEYKLIKKDSYMIDDPIERAKRWIEEETERQQLRIANKELTTEVMRKEDVIVGLVDDISLTEKRRRITDIVRHGAKKNYAERYNKLYEEFEMKYHIDLERRMKSQEAQNMKPKIKNKMDYIDRCMNKIPELYEVCCKLFENDIEALVEEMYGVSNKEDIIGTNEILVS